jgi:hypothetical protein
LVRADCYQADADSSVASADEGANQSGVLASMTLADRVGERPVIMIHNDGVVQMSGDMLLGGEPLYSGRLTAAELVGLRERLRRITFGIDGRAVEFSVQKGVPYHRILINLGGPEDGMVTTIRFHEMEQWKEARLFAANLIGQNWSENFDGGTRYAAMHTLPPDHLAKRAIWLELEAEIVRAAGQSVLPDDARRPVELWKLP